LFKVLGRADADRLLESDDRIDLHKQLIKALDPSSYDESKGAAQDVWDVQSVAAELCEPRSGRPTTAAR